MTESYSAELGITEFELDLFGRVQQPERRRTAAVTSRTEEARRSAQLSLIAEVANAYLTLAADQELRAARQRHAARPSEEAYALTQRRHELGAVSALDVHQARTQVETARADAARYAGQVAQDANALNLAGRRAGRSRRCCPPASTTRVSGLGALPAGLPSEVLLRRPDVLQAEHLLRAANANIGAARAAFFPSITPDRQRSGPPAPNYPTCSAAARSRGASFRSINVPIFQGGRLRGESWRGHRRPRHRTGAVREGRSRKAFARSPTRWR